MAEKGAEPIRSLGHDAPLAALNPERQKSCRLILKKVLLSLQTLRLTVIARQNISLPASLSGKDLPFYHHEEVSEIVEFQRRF